MSGDPGEGGPRRGDLFLYLLGTGAWFASLGIQTVMFAWLVTVRLDESPDRVGLAQMSLMVPTLCLLLLAGAVADRVGGARVALRAQLLALLPVAGLAAFIAEEALVYPVLIGYALTMGMVQAFVTPARDGILAQVAGGRVQRTVVMVSLVQFGVQIGGFNLSGLAERLGPLPVLGMQAVILAAGGIAFALLGRRLRAPVRDGPHAPFAAQIREGLGTVLASPAMRSVTLLNMCVGLFFIGAFQVGVPLLVREVHDGAPSEFALVNTMHMSGIVATTLTLLWLGDVERRGRALIVGLVVGGSALICMGLSTSFAALLGFNVVWGLCAGMFMSMGRTIMQESAPPDRRARVMAFYSLSFMGAAPLGALLAGFMVELVGVHLALVIPGTLVACAAVVVALRSTLWRLALIPV